MNFMIHKIILFIRYMMIYMGHVKFLHQKAPTYVMLIQNLTNPWAENTHIFFTNPIPLQIETKSFKIKDFKKLLIFINIRAWDTSYAYTVCEPLCRHPFSTFDSGVVSSQGHGHFVVVHTKSENLF